MNIIVYDTETTGLPIWGEPSEGENQPHLVDIAGILYAKDGTELEAFDAIIKPDGWVIPADMTAIHGISQEQAMDEGIPENEALAAFLELHDKAGLRVGHNESFDARILRIAIKRFGDVRLGLQPQTQEDRDRLADLFKTAPTYCTCNKSKPLVKLPPTEKMMANPRFRNSYKPPNLQEAHQHFLGVPFDGAHRAKADAEACARIYFAMNLRIETLDSAPESETVQ